MNIETMIDGIERILGESLEDECEQKYVHDIGKYKRVAERIVRELHDQGVIL